MRVTDRNIFLTLLGGVTAVGVATAEFSHQSISMTEIFAGLAVVTLAFVAWLGVNALRTRAWPRTLARIDHADVRYFWSAQFGHTWQVALSYTYSPLGASPLASLHGRETLEFQGGGEAATGDIQAKAKAGRQVYVEYDPAAPAASRVVTKRAAPVFAD
jgi:hypothetical protein